MSGAAPFAPARPVLYFDGHCNLCNGFVQRVLRWDRRGVFLFASLQSSAGAKAVSALGGASAPDSLVVEHRGRMYTKSDAALYVAQVLGGGFRLVALLRFLPKAVRNAVYDFVARNRYRWFGRQETCALPTPETAARFLNDPSPAPAAAPGRMFHA